MVVVGWNGGTMMGGKQIETNLRYNCASVKLDKSCSHPPPPHTHTIKSNIGSLLVNLEHMYFWEHYNIV